MKLNKIITGLTMSMAIILPMFLFSPVTHAQFNPDPTKGSTLGVDKADNNGDLVATIFTVIRALLKIVFVVAVLVFVIAGLFFLTSNGGDRADTARDMLTYAIIGLVVSVLGYAIVLFLSNALIGTDQAASNSWGQIQ